MAPFACARVSPTEPSGTTATEPTAEGGVRARAHFFPLFYADRVADDELFEVDALWPFYMHRSEIGGDGRLNALRPIFSSGHDSDGLHYYLDFLYPLGGARFERDEKNPDDFSRRRWFVPFYFHKQTHDEGRDADHTIFFPFVYKGRKNPPGAG